MAMVAIDDRTRIASSRRPSRGSGLVHRASAWNLRVLGRLPHGPRPCRPSGRPGTPRRRPDVSLRHLGSTFRLVATMATMATPRGPTSKKNLMLGIRWWVITPSTPPLLFFFKVQFRGGHGGHGGHDTRTAPETQRAAASARGRRVQALRCARRAQRAWDGDSRTREASSHAWRPPVMDEPHYPTGVPHVGARMSRYGTQGRLLARGHHGHHGHPRGPTSKKDLDSPK